MKKRKGKVLYFFLSSADAQLFSGSGGTSRTLNSNRTLNYFRGPGAPRGRLILIGRLNILKIYHHVHVAEVLALRQKRCELLVRLHRLLAAGARRRAPPAREEQDTRYNQRRN